jgi:chloramphenicol 3-O-phosphotransferase
MSRVIIINGPSCAGKTTIAKEICSQSNNKFVHLQVDESKKYLFTILDAKATPRNIGRPICDNILMQTALIFLQNGYGVVIDTIFDGDDATQIAKYHLNFFKDHITLFVGIDCSTEERLKRFQTNNNNPVRNEATIIAQSNVFESCKEFYDIWFDSSLLNGEEIAESIFQHTKNPQKDIVPQFVVRTSHLSDTLAMVSLSKAKRLAYEKAQPQFWCYAGDAGDKIQHDWFCELLNDKNHIMFAAESDAKEILGFVIGKLMPAPEVYNPGGLTLMIDDFCVQSENLWQSVGIKLIEKIKAAAKVKGATQVVVVSGSHDLPKRKFLSEQNLQVASEWFVGGIV